MKWKNNPEFQDYYLFNNLGEVKSLRGKEKILKPDNGSYKLISADGKSKRISINKIKSMFGGEIENLKNEEWMPINIFNIKANIYAVSNMGRIKNIERDIILKTFDKSPNEKYQKVRMTTSDGCQHTFSVHRIVATIFIPNPRNVETVNHINFDVTDNRVENLEWLTMSENIQHYLDSRV